MPDSPAFGDFDFRTVVNTFEPRLEKMVPWEQRFGLNLQVQYIYGGFHAADGTLTAIERKFSGPMTGGAWLMSDESGTLALHPGAMHTARGETIRQFSDTSRKWSNHLMHTVGKDVSKTPDQPLSLELEGDKLLWSEGDLLQLEGSLIGPGVQFYAPMRDEPLFYTTHAYWVNGTAFGQDVTGFVGFDHGYWQHGREWKEYRVYQDLEIAWQVFGNQFDDGTVEWGLLMKSKQGLACGVVHEGDTLIAMADDVPATFTIDSEDFIDTARFTVGDKQWEFTARESGKMKDFNRARWAGYKSQSGVTRRVGDKRKVKHGFAWIEAFSDRIKSEGLAGR